LSRQKGGTRSPETPQPAAPDAPPEKRFDETQTSSIRRYEMERKQLPQQEQETAEKKERMKNGEELFDWKLFDQGFGIMIRSLDRLYQAYDLHDKRGATKQDESFDRLRKLLGDFRNGFLQRYEELAKKPAPRLLKGRYRGAS
jgi:hypothetical protein